MEPRVPPQRHPQQRSFETRWAIGRHTKLAAWAGAASSSDTPVRSGRATLDHCSRASRRLRETSAGIAAIAPATAPSLKHGKCPNAREARAGSTEPEKSLESQSRAAGCPIGTRENPVRRSRATHSRAKLTPKLDQCQYRALLAVQRTLPRRREA